jgi:hypothetical protein
MPQLPVRRGVHRNACGKKAGSRVLRPLLLGSVLGLSFTLPLVAQADEPQPYPAPPGAGSLPPPSILMLPPESATPPGSVPGQPTQAIPQYPQYTQPPPAAAAPAPAPVAAPTPAPAAPAAQSAPLPEPAQPLAQPGAAPADSAQSAAQPAAPPEHVQHGGAFGPGHGPQPHKGRPGAQAGRGFVVSASLGVRPLTSPTMNNGNLGQTQGFTTQGGLAIGFKTGRLMLTLGLDLTSYDKKDTFSYQSTAAFLVIPGVQVAIVRSRDQHVELVGSLRLGAGATMTSDPTSTTQTPVIVMYEIAPAIRWWAHKQFAVQMLAGYGGEYSILRNTTATTASGLHSLVTSIGAVGVF